MLATIKLVSFFVFLKEKKRKRLIALDLTIGFGTSLLTCTAKLKQVMFHVSSFTESVRRI